jgi:hypothetical protein
VSNVLSTTPLNIGFRRALMENKQVRWIHLVQHLMDVNLETKDDVFKWNLTTTGNFRVKSMYLHMINGHTRLLEICPRGNNNIVIIIFHYS